uniref:Uncharacterized protein n=2 Tax=Nomascus leucogenys TaxID=61853 RepID=A0A2I3GYH6_NOMLE
MGVAMRQSVGIKDLKLRMQQALDRFLNEMGNAESGYGQVMCRLAELEHNFKDGYLDVVETHYQEQHL